MARPNIEAIEALAEKATAGPWCVMHRQNVVASDRRGATTASGLDGDNERNEANAAFIAASRTSIPELIAYVRELEEAGKTIVGLLPRLDHPHINVDDWHALIKAIEVLAP